MATPQFGAGRPSEYSIDQVNQWMRAQPWWAQIRGAPGSKLTDAKKKAILRQAQASGVVVDEGDMEVDPAGNFNPKGHKLRNTLIVAGIAGATLATMGAAGVFSGAAGAGAGAGAGGGAGAAGAGAGAGTAAGATGGAGILGTASSLGPMVNPALAGAIPAAAGGAVVPTIAPGLAGSLSAGSMIPTASSVGLGGLGAAGAGAGGAFDAAGNFIGDSTVTNQALDRPWWQTALGVADRVGKATGDWEEGRRAQRQDESLAAYRQNLANEARFRSMLASRELALKAPTMRADASIRGDRLANAQPIHIQRPANIPDLAISGGFSPANWSENTRALGRQMSANALAGSGTDELTPPELERSPQANTLDSILNTASLVSAIPYTRQGRRVPRPGDPDYVPTQNA